MGEETEGRNVRGLMKQTACVLYSESYSHSFAPAQSSREKSMTSIQLCAAIMKAIQGSHDGPWGS